MTEKELKKWFCNIFYSCYSVKHDNFPRNIYLYYDKLYLRKNILLNILGKELEEPKEIRGECIFELDLKNDYLWCDYNMIWSVLEKNYSTYNYSDVQTFIKSCLEDYNKLFPLTTFDRDAHLGFTLDEYDKLKIVTTESSQYLKSPELEEIDKLKIMIIHQI
jgi:hypothetical protein